MNNDSLSKSVSGACCGSCHEKQRASDVLDELRKHRQATFVPGYGYVDTKIIDALKVLIKENHES